MSQTTTIKIIPADEDEAKSIVDRLQELHGVVIEIRTARSFASVPVISKWSMVGGEFFIIFETGIIDLLGRTLNERELLAAAGRTVSH